MTETQNGSLLWQMADDNSVSLLLMTGLKIENNATIKYRKILFPAISAREEK